MKYARVENGMIVERREMDPASIPSHKAAIWKECVLVDAVPTATQVREGPALVIEPTRVIETFTVRDKTAAEIGAEKEGTLNSFDRLAFEVLFDHENRLRALKVPPLSALTKLQFRAALKVRL